MPLTIRPLREDSDAEAFRTLNEQWIAQHFVIETEDRRQLEDPVAAYLDPGGEILIADLDGRAVGCIALMPDGTGAYELSKMAISPDLRGQGGGRKLLQAAPDRLHMPYDRADVFMELVLEPPATEAQSELSRRA